MNCIICRCNAQPARKGQTTLKSFTIGVNDEGMRLSRFVKRVTRGLPDPQMHKSFRNKRVKVNGKRAIPDTRLVLGDTVELYLNDVFFPYTHPVRPVLQSSLPAFKTEYEDAHIAVLYKSAGLLSHRDAKGLPTLLDAFTHALTQSGEYTPEAENTFAPALCNRLDQGTEGLILAAKQATALRDMNEIIRLGLLHKTYLCVCLGTPAQGLHHANLARNRHDKKVTIYPEEQQETKPITTEVHILEKAGALSLCQVVLHTGRTHQIRAHLAYLGAPVLGDAKYGGKAFAAKYVLPFQLLCAMQLRFSQDLPNNSLAYLSGRAFTASYAALPKWWEAHKQSL